LSATRIGFAWNSNRSEDYSTGFIIDYAYTQKYEQPFYHNEKERKAAKQGAATGKNIQGRHSWNEHRAESERKHSTKRPSTGVGTICPQLIAIILKLSNQALTPKPSA
jgi:hypothetical protein